MNNGLYISTTGLLLNQRRMDAVANNLANANTTGFKRDIVISESFPEILTSKINDKDFKTLRAFKGVEVNQDGDVYQLSVNNGYFRVKTPVGIGYPQELKFTVDDDGYLKTYYRDKNDNLKSDGENYIMGKKGIIKVEDKNITIDNQGNVLSNGQIIDNLVTFAPMNVIGTTNRGVRLDKVVIDFTQGNLIETGNKLDFALKGDGFFKVQDGDRTLYTRDGTFSLNENGELITSEGYYVLGQYGSIIVQGDDFTINENGEIIRDGQVIDKLDIVDIDNKEYLRKKGNNSYEILEGVEPLETAFQGQVLRGYLEGSNINTIKEMVDMISILRSYETSQKLVQYQDELIGKVVSEVGRV